MAEIRSKSSEDLTSSKQKIRDRSTSSSSLKGRGNSPHKNKASNLDSGEETGIDFDNIFGSKDTSKTHKEEGGNKSDKLTHLTASRPKAPKRRPPSSHFTPGTNSSQVTKKHLNIYFNSLFNAIS